MRTRRHAHQRGRLPRTLQEDSEDPLGAEEITQLMQEVMHEVLDERDGSHSDGGHAETHGSANQKSASNRCRSTRSVSPATIRNSAAPQPADCSTPSKEEADEQATKGVDEALAALQGLDSAQVTSCNVM